MSVRLSPRNARDADAKYYFRHFRFSFR
jgi:hypothetical protein